MFSPWPSEWARSFGAACFNLSFIPPGTPPARPAPRMVRGSRSAALHARRGVLGRIRGGKSGRGAAARRSQTDRFHGHPKRPLRGY